LSDRDGRANVRDEIVEMTGMPSCLVRGVRSIELVATNLEEASRFYETVWNLTPVGRANDAAYFRGTAPYHHIVGLHRGAQPAVVRIVFDVSGRREVDELHRAVAAAGSAASKPGSWAGAGGGYGFGCKDPDGRNLAFIADCADHAGGGDAPDRPRKIVHINLNARDADASLRFFTQTLGFRLVDENAPLSFLHCANTDHCSIVLCEMDLPTLNHIAFDMPELDSVMRGMGRMKDNGYPIEWGPGRHGPGNNVFAYFCGPDEVPLEYAAEVQQIDDSYVPRSSDYWKFKPGRSEQWGITAPRSPRYYRVQRLFGFTADGDRLA
jgi:catechol 2,3-dioxygenase-like lactoylglutathione lyase family enzyme